jgi:curli production assembly/transport component CsgG
MRLMLRAATIAGLAVLAGCAAPGMPDPFERPPTLTPTTATRLGLEQLPAPDRKVYLAIYAFPDLTGQNKPNDNIAEYSRAVTQGGAAFAVDAFRRAGGGSWFSVVERNGLPNLLQERQLIRATRQEFDGQNARPLPPIKFAGLIVEGGILAYDANTMTGGLGAHYLGVGGDVKYRRDMVTVGMRIVSGQSGEVLNSVTTTKTIYSVGVSASAYRFVALNKLFEAEAGVTQSEPTQFAVRQAIDLAVYATVLEGARQGLWKFRDREAGSRLIQEYLQQNGADAPLENTQASAG